MVRYRTGAGLQRIFAVPEAGSNLVRDGVQEDFRQQSVRHGVHIEERLDPAVLVAAGPLRLPDCGFRPPNSRGPRSHAIRPPW